MNEQLISFETAKLAKKKGFDWVVFGDYTKDGILIHTTPTAKYKAPTQSLLQKWLREEKEIFIDVSYGNLNKKWYYSVSSTGFGETKKDYEEALEAGLKEALNLIK